MATTPIWIKDKRDRQVQILINCWTCYVRPYTLSVESLYFTSQSVDKGKQLFYPTNKSCKSMPFSAEKKYDPVMKTGCREKKFD